MSIEKIFYLDHPLPSFSLPSAPGVGGGRGKKEGGGVGAGCSVGKIFLHILFLGISMWPV
jgi:hypothetical protein